MTTEPSMFDRNAAAYALIDIKAGDAYLQENSIGFALLKLQHASMEMGSIKDLVLSKQIERKIDAYRERIGDSIQKERMTAQTMMCVDFVLRSEKRKEEAGLLPKH